MIVGVPRESYPGERRVALVPAVLPLLTKAGIEVVIEAGAGASAGYPDADYTAKDGRVLPDRAEVFRTADVIVQVLCYGAFYFVGEVDEFARHCPPRRVGRRIRHAAGRRWNAPASRHRRLRMASCRAGFGHHHRRPPRQSSHDRRPTADRTKSRVRRIVRHPCRHG